MSVVCFFRKPYLIIVLLAIIIASCSTGGHIYNTQDSAAHLEWVKKELQQPGNSNVLVTAHRGDWRNAPENSVQGLKNCIAMGVDIVEFDLGITKDGHLVVMHDKTIDRTTTGTGKPEQYSLEALKKLRLKNATGHATAHTIPTLEEMLTAAKGKIMVCIDKGFTWFDQAMDLVRSMGMEEQVIYNVPAMPLDSMKMKGLKNFDDGVLVNLLSFPTDTTMARKIMESYAHRKNAILHPTFANDTIAFVTWMKYIKENRLGLWLNSLWPEHSGGHDDDRAVDNNEPDEAWGWLAKQGATIIQTDRPAALLNYLKKHRLHP